MITYSVFRRILKIFVPRVKFMTSGNDLKQPAVFVANHEDSFGPISSYLFFPFRIYPWIMHYLIDRKACSAHIEDNFFNKELRLKRPLSRILAWITGQLCVGMFRNIGAIPVYQNSRRIIETIYTSIQYLDEGKNLIIFPEIPDEYLNEFINRFHTGFLGIVEKIYESETKLIYVYPVCIDKKKRIIMVGNPSSYHPGRNFSEEKKRITAEMELEITRMKKNVTTFQPATSGSPVSKTL
jgi:hypothetical protein